jgi:oligopeptide transport system ATP-binding protein
LVEVRDLTKVFVARSGLFGGSRYIVNAVDRVSFDISAGETLGLVGETGAGKSTVGRLVLGLETPSRGSIKFRGAPLPPVDRRTKAVHRDIQVIFQNPYASLNPSMTVVDLVAEPIDVHNRLSKTQRSDAVGELLKNVGLGREYLRRYVYELSGGQLQRVAIARALAVNPKLIVLDEPTTALDVSSQAQVINLLQELQATYGLSYLLIGHNLAVVSHTSDRLAILYAGQIVELGDSETVYHRPRHPYTQTLIGAILSIDPSRRRTGRRSAQRRRAAVPAVSANGEGPALDVTGPGVFAGLLGCVYALRCPLAEDVCRTDAPPIVTFDDGTFVRCHFADAAVVMGPTRAGQGPPEPVGSDIG